MTKTKTKNSATVVKEPCRDFVKKGNHCAFYLKANDNIRHWCIKGTVTECAWEGRQTMHPDPAAGKVFRRGGR